MKIQSVNLLTDYLKEQEEFYARTFGLTIVERTNKSFTVEVGRSFLIFEESEKAGDKPFYHFAFDIPGNKVSESIHWLNSRGISLNLLPNHTIESYLKTWNSTSIYFYDPAGNIVEFIARHNLENNTNNPFDEKNLLNISEIGLVVGNVPEAKETLGSRFTIEEYKDSSDKFAAIGDEHGLFILSEYDRIWLGSNKKARYFKTEVKIEGVGKEEYVFNDFPYKIIGC